MTPKERWKAITFGVLLLGYGISAVFDNESLMLACSFFLWMLIMDQLIAAWQDTK